MNATKSGGANDARNGDDELRAMLKSAVPPVSGERERDLWPQMLARLEDAPALAHRAKSVPWFDWVLAAAAVACVVWMPKVIPLLLFHL